MQEGSMDAEERARRLSEDGSIDQIREILLGAHLQNINKDLSKIKTKLAEIEDTINEHNKSHESSFAMHNDRIDQLDKTQNQIKNVIKELEAGLEHKINDLLMRKVDRQQIGQALIALGEKIEQSSNGRE